MRKIFYEAKIALIWIGSDSDNYKAKVAVESIFTTLDFLCQRLGLSALDLSSVDNLYQEVIFKYCDILSVPNKYDFSIEIMWKSLVWFYSYLYFMRVWYIQEVNTNKNRLLYCGLEKVIWDRVSLVVYDITMETVFLQVFGFINAYCQQTAIVTIDLVQPRKQLLVLYLTFNFSSLDLRDMIYGLRGMMELDKRADLL